MIGLLLAAWASAEPLPQWLVDPTDRAGRDPHRLIRRGTVAWPAFAPVEPPTDSRGDIAPPTPVFDAEPGWTWKHVGLGPRSLRGFPGGDGAGVVVADVEYSWTPDHEALAGLGVATLGGDDLQQFAGHGNAVLGIVGAAADGFGVTGGVPGAMLAIAHPYVDGVYDVAGAIRQSALQLQPGDVLLIEQQVLVEGVFSPVSADPLVGDAVREAVSAGIVVIEPAGNGGASLDDPGWEGWFDAGGAGDTGSILVGAGVPGTLAESGTWVGGSNHGSLVAVQGWGSSIPAPSSPEYGTDLFFPAEDPRQAYTEDFGGTSGASAQVASVAAQLQAMSMAIHGEVIAPDALRAWLTRTGHPQPADSAALYPIGPTVDARAAFATYLVP